MSESKRCSQCGGRLPESDLLGLGCARCMLELGYSKKSVPFNHAADDFLPETIGRYRILRVISEGGMGTVYEAEQEQPHRAVALKIIKRGIASAELLWRFELETEALGRLQHPGIAHIYEAGTVDTGFGPQPYFAMELIKGLQPREFAELHHLDTRQRTELMIKICDAVHHAHQRGLIHRDLKPANILVDEAGQPKILDFGVVRVTDGDTRWPTETKYGQLIGTLPYMSPEQALADPLELDTRTDIYSLGIIFYELLTGCLPYVVSKQTGEAIQTIQYEDPVKISAVNRSYRGDIETIVGTALEKDKTRRYQSVFGLAIDLRRTLTDEPIAARPPSLGYQLWKFARRHKTFAARTAAVFLGLVAGLITVTWKLNTYSSEADAHMRPVLEQLVSIYSGTPTSEELSRRFPQIESIIKVDIIDYQSRKSGVTSPMVQFGIEKLISLYTGFDPPKYSDAEDFVSKIAIDYRLALGEGNALTLKLEKQLLGLYMVPQPQPKLAEAEKEFEDEFEAKRNALGDENPATQVTLNYLVSIYLEQGTVGYAKAASLLEPIVNETHRKLRSESPATRNASIALANVYLKQGRYREAEILLIPYATSTAVADAIVHPRELLEQIAVPDQPWPISVHTYGGMPANFIDAMTRITILEHTSIVDVLDLQAQTYDKQGRSNEAQETKKHLNVILEAALSSTRSVGGWEFGRPLKSMGVMAIRYIEEDRLVDADVMVNSVLDGYSQVAGKSSNAEEIATLLTSAALTYTAKDNYPKAERLLNSIVKIDEGGASRNFTLSHSLVRLKSWYMDRGRTQDARRIEERMKVLLPVSDQPGQSPAQGTPVQRAGVYDSVGFIPK